jgi:flagellar hook assembly protein FlgD
MYDRGGHKIIEILNAALPAGEHVLEWNGRDDRGNVVAPGSYVGKIVVRNQVQWFKLIVTR